MAILRTYHDSSTNLKVTQFNTSTRIMRVLFRSKWTYIYYGVSRAVYEAISAGAPRGGKIFNEKLKWSYPYRAINQNNDIEFSNIPPDITAELFVQRIEFQRLIGKPVDLSTVYYTNHSKTVQQQVELVLPL